MSDEPYLIAHVVRGQPAFDVAIRCDDMGTPSDPGPWWIIPTSGHRARPYWHKALDELCDHNEYHAGKITKEVPTAPLDWPDHYPTPLPRKSAESPKLGAADLLKDLGL